MKPSATRVSVDEFWECHKLFARSHGGLSVEAFDLAYDIIVSTIGQVSTFSDGGLDPTADYASSRYVDPIPCVTITTLEFSPDSEILSSLGLEIIKRIGKPFCIIFDTEVGYHGIFSDGRILTTLEQ